MNQRFPQFRWMWAVLAFGAVSSACNPTYAPPPRAGLGGAPPVPVAGQVDVGAAAFVTAGPFGETGDLSVGVNRWVQIETGVWGAQVGVLLGYVGARVNPLADWRSAGKVLLTSDIEIGGGAGAGGRNCSNPISESCEAEGLRNRPPAGGGYVGGSVGMRAAWFDLYLRARLQLAGANEVPLTVWYTGLAGIQITVAKRMRLFAGGGYIGYDNSADTQGGALGEMGFSVLFPHKKKENL